MYVSKASLKNFISHLTGTPPVSNRVTFNHLVARAQGLSPVCSKVFKTRTLRNAKDNAHMVRTLCWLEARPTDKNATDFEIFFCENARTITDGKITNTSVSALRAHENGQPVVCDIFELDARIKKYHAEQHELMGKLRVQHKTMFTLRAQTAEEKGIPVSSVEYPGKRMPMKMTETKLHETDITFRPHQYEKLFIAAPVKKVFSLS